MIDLHLWSFLERTLLVKDTQGIDVISQDALPKLKKYTETMFKLSCVKATLNTPEKFKRFLEALAHGNFPEGE